MSPTFFVFLITGLVIAGLIIFLVIKWRKSHSSPLYKQGLYNENEGNYQLALDNYSDALNEIRSLNIKNSLSRKIAERIKILRSTIAYEKNFQPRDAKPVAKIAHRVNELR